MKPCANGQVCVSCNFGPGQAGYCPDPTNSYKDYCNPDLFQGFCACSAVGGINPPQVSTPQVSTALETAPNANPDTATNPDPMKISFIEPIVDIANWPTDPIPDETPSVETPSVEPPSVETPSEEPQSAVSESDLSADYEPFLVPRGFARDHIKGGLYQ
jgi:hypothetical protein